MGVLVRFDFADLPVRGALVRLDQAWGRKRAQVAAARLVESGQASEAVAVVRSALTRVGPGLQLVDVLVDACQGADCAEEAAELRARFEERRLP